MTEASSIVQQAEKLSATAAAGLRNAGQYVVEQAKDLGSGASNAATYLGQKTDEGAAAVSGGLKVAARTIRANGPQDGSLGQANLAVAQSFSNSANYLDGTGLKGTVDDISHMIASNPVTAVLFAVGAGFMLGRTTSRS